MTPKRTDDYEIIGPGGGSSTLDRRDRELLRQYGGATQREGIPADVWAKFRLELERKHRRDEAAARKRARCGARCRTKGGAPCEAPLTKPPNGNGKRCRMHGGNHKGPKTPEGRARALANLKRGKA